MDKFWSRAACAAEPYTPGEQPSGGVLIKLNTNENAYPPSPRIAEAAVSAAGRLRLYPPADSRPLRRSLAGLYGIEEDWTFAGNGSDEVLALAFLAYFDRGAAVAWPAVTYSFYPVYARLYGMEAHPMPMSNGLAADIPALLSHNGPVVLANPNAPTGIAIPVETIEEIARSCEKKGFAMVVDEAYSAFSGDSAARILKDHPNLVVVGTLSKSHALAGMRVGFALGRPELLGALWRIKDCFNSYPLDHVALAVGAAALDDREYFLEKTAAIVATREKFSRDLQKMDFDVLPSGANFVFARRPGVSGARLQAELRGRGILVRRFDTPGIEDWLRVTVGTPEQMEAVTSAMREIVG